MGSVSRPGRRPGCCSARRAGAPPWSQEAVSLLQQVEGNPGGRGLGVAVVGDQG